MGEIQMRKKGYSLVAALLLALSIAVPSARADASVTGETFTLALTGLPSSATAGDVVEATLAITLLDSIRAVRRQVSYVVSVDSAFGDAVLRSGTFSMTSGTTRTVDVSLPISESLTAGTYTLRVTTTIANETLEVAQSMDIGGKR